MGVDFWICQRCRGTFPDCGDYERCEQCERHWCSSYCADEDGLEKSEDCDEWGIYETSCSYCRNEAVEDSDLLEYALVLFDITREELEQRYFDAQD